MSQMIGLALLPALLDWWAVSARRSAAEALAKPLVMVMLIIGVVIVDAPGFNMSGTARWCVAFALICSLTGDVALLPTIDRFIVGLASFFVGHLFYIAAFVVSASELSLSRSAFGVVLGVGVVVTVGRQVIAGATRSNSTLRLPVIAYVLVLATMLMTGIIAGGWLGAAGAGLFAMSDGILGWNRFVDPLKRGRLYTHMTYHLGQGLIALWVIGL